MADTVDHLARLPAKLLDQIAKDCLSPKDLASLTMTSSHYAAMVIPILRKKRTRDEWADPYKPSTIQTSAAVVSGDTQGPDYLAKLPAEILLHIAEDSCLSTRDLATFARTSSRYTDTVISVLYKKNIREENANARKLFCYTDISCPLLVIFEHTLIKELHSSLGYHKTEYQYPGPSD